MKRLTIGFPITLDVADKKIVVVGGGDEALAKIAPLLAAQAQVTRLVPENSPTPNELDPQMTYMAASYQPSLLTNAALVLYLGRDVDMALAIYNDAHQAQALCWCADDPEHSDFAMPAVAHLGAASISISTGGRSPTLARLCREQIEAALGERFGRFVNTLGMLRQEVSQKTADVAVRKAVLLDALRDFHIDLTIRYPSWFE